MPLAEFRSGESTPRRLYFYHLAQADRWFAAWDADDGERWFLQDHRNSVRGVIRKDGAPVAWADYDAFGRLISGDPVLLGPVRFTGRLWSEAAGLYDFRARHYATELGRFLQEDPSLFAAGDLNMYRYVRNDPWNMTDPTGKTPALEYAILACKVSVKALEDGGKIGACVKEMIGSAAAGLYGIQAGNGAACAVDYVTEPLTDAMEKYHAWFSLEAWEDWAYEKAHDKAMDELFGFDPFKKPDCDTVRSIPGN